MGDGVTAVDVGIELPRGNVHFLPIDGTAVMPAKDTAKLSTKSKISVSKAIRTVRRAAIARWRKT
jgi:hypothetical protein